MNEEEEIAKIRDELRRRNAASDQELANEVRSELTDEQVQRDWDDIRGASTNRPSSRDGEKEGTKIVGINLGRKLLPLAAVIVAAAVIWIFWIPSPHHANEFDYQLAARSDGTTERGFGATLPKTLSVKFSKKLIAVATDQESLNGAIQPLPAETTPDEAVFRVDVSGIDGDGKRGEFKGRMRVVRSSPNAPIEKRENIQRIILDGDFKVGAQPAFPTSRAYYP